MFWVLKPFTWLPDVHQTHSEPRPIHRKELTFKVVNIDEEHRNIILSRKQVLEDEAVEKRNELLQKIEIGSELDGEVKNITQYGAFNRSWRN